MLVINWLNDSAQILNIGIQDLVNQVKDICATFVKISTWHIFCEHDTVADQLSKAGSLVTKGCFILDGKDGLMEMQT